MFLSLRGMFVRINQIGERTGEHPLKRSMHTCVLVIGLVVLGASSAAAAAAPELPVSDLFTPPGHMTKLARVAYEASKLPLPVRLPALDGSWTGAQWKANEWSPYEIARRHSRCPRACLPPYYGWAAHGKGGTSPTAAPRGLILVMAGFSRTPSVAATVESLRNRGHGASYEQTSPVTIGGFAGTQFDGEVTGLRHVFIPFSPRTHKATGFPDAIETGTGDVFRFVVLDVRGKTVVIFIDSAALSADEFPAFLGEAQAVVSAIRFPV